MGGLDVLINNAGIGIRTVNPRFLSDPQPFWKVPEDGFLDVVVTNLTGYFLVASAFVPDLLTVPDGRIVIISMNHSTMNRAGFVPYGPRRAGAEALSRITAADLAGSSVTVNLLLPDGATVTGMIPDSVTGTSALLPADVMGTPPSAACAPPPPPAPTTNGSSPPSSTPGSSPTDASRAGAGPGRGSHR